MICVSGVPNLEATVNMETGSRDAISIKLERILSIGRPKVENIDTRTEVSRLSLNRVLLGRQCSHPETKPPIVTNNRNIQSKCLTRLFLSF